jgi:hypothetical protein
MPRNLQQSESLNKSSSTTPLNREERLHVTWASLVILEKRLKMRLAQIEIEKRAILAAGRAQ